MATTLIDTHTHAAAGATDDPFHEPAMAGVAAAFVVLGLIVLVLTGVVIWGVQYRSPGWSAHSYPPPVVHRW